MNSFRNPKYLERREDVVFDLEQPLATNPANDATQNRSNIRFVADNTGEVTPFDWYNARISMDFKVNLLANGGDIGAADHNGIVNGSNAFIKKLTILANGREVYSCNNANQCVNIKNLLEYSPSYAESIATNEFYFLDSTRNPDEDRFTTRQVQHGRNDADNGWEARNFVESFSATYNKGFAARKALLGTSDTVNCEIPINRFSFFESLENKLLPNTRIELKLEIDKDDNFIWQNGANCRIIITRLHLFVPRLIFNAEGQKLYMENDLKPYKWSYLNEVVETSNNTKQQTGLFKITIGISKPRHVFIFIINSASIDSQTVNPFLYNTFSISTNPRTLNRCYLEVGNGNEYPELHYKPNTDLSRVYRDVMSYVYANNDFQGGTLLTRSNFESLFPFVYFDLTKQKMDIKDGVTKLTFHYELSGAATTDYNIYAFVLHEKDAEIDQQTGKLLLRA